MRNRVGILLTVALACGGLAAFLAFNVLREPGGATASEASGPTVGVVVAARDMEMGRLIETGDVSLVDWPAESVPEGYSTSPAEVVGRGLLAPVKTNEPLLSTKLARKDGGGGLPIGIPEGMRAMTVKVDDVTGVAGYTRPNTRVDVLVTLSQSASVDEPATQIVLQGVQVLTAGKEIQQDVNGEPKSVPYVTLLVPPEDAEKLALAASNGRIQLALRNTLDLDTVATPGIRAATLLQLGRGQARPSAPVSRGYVPRSTRVNVDVYRGPVRETSTVDSGGGSGGAGGSGGGG